MGAALFDLDEIAGNVTLVSAESFLAPAKTQARSTATSSGLGCLAFLGGIAGLVLPSGNSTNRLSLGLPGTITFPLLPPCKIPLKVSKSSSPLAVLLLWHSRQYRARNGRTCLE